MAEKRYEIVIDLNSFGGADGYMTIASPTGNSIRIYKSQVSEDDRNADFLIGILLKMSDAIMLFFDSCKYEATREEMATWLTISKREIK